jgi:hypothetical protein
VVEEPSRSSALLESSLAAASESIEVQEAEEDKRTRGGGTVGGWKEREELR